VRFEAQAILYLAGGDTSSSADHRRRDERGDDTHDVTVMSRHGVQDIGDR
jgi:hypothetical protein